MVSNYDAKFARLLKAQQTQERGQNTENDAILDILAQIKQDILDIKDTTNYNVLIKFDKRLRKVETFLERLQNELRKE